MKANENWLAQARVGILASIGRTPLVRLERLALSASHELYAKVEGHNPGGSSKDRSAMSMIAGATARGDLLPGGTVIESSSGNMGIGLAQICLRLGLRFICVTDERTVSTNIRLLKLYGAELEVIRSDSQSSMSLLERRLTRVQELLASNPGSYWPNQYANLDNPAAHQETLREIVNALRVPLILFSARLAHVELYWGALSTFEVSLFLQDSSLWTRWRSIFGTPSGTRLLPGMGAAVVPALMANRDSFDNVRVSDSECVSGCRAVLGLEAMLVGGSSGAVAAAYFKHAPTMAGGSICVLIFPDRGERYLDTIFSEDWLSQNGLAELEDQT